MSNVIKTPEQLIDESPLCLVEARTKAEVARIALAYASQFNEWVRVGDRFPDAGDDVLMCDGDGDVFGGYIDQVGNWHYDGSGTVSVSAITHWQPLPTPPKS